MQRIENSPDLPASVPAAMENSTPVIRDMFTDPNQIARVTGWELDIRQIESGSMRTDVLLRPGRLVSLLEFRFSHKVHQTGESPKGVVTLGLPISRKLMSWGGNEIDGIGLLGFGDGDELNAVSDSGFQGITFSISKAAMVKLADDLRIDLPDSVFQPLFHSPADAIESLRAVSGQTRKLLRSGGQGLRLDHEEEILAAVLLAATHSPATRDNSSLQARTRAVRTALALMNDAAEDGISVARMCQDTGVSWRTLDRAFKDQFGIGPKAYHNRMRLNRARSDLESNKGGLRVADAANRWGFWHLGQFASDYKKLFGELPSQTASKRH